MRTCEITILFEGPSSADRASPRQPNRRAGCGWAERAAAIALLGLGTFVLIENSRNPRGVAPRGRQTRFAGCLSPSGVIGFSRLQAIDECELRA